MGRQEVFETVVAQISGYGVDPSWLFGSISLIAVFLLWSQIKDIKDAVRDIHKDLKNMMRIIGEHDRDIARLKDKNGIK